MPQRAWTFAPFSKRLIASCVVALVAAGCGGSDKFVGLTKKEAAYHAREGVIGDYTVEDIRHGKTPFGKPSWVVTLSENTSSDCLRAWIWDPGSGYRLYAKAC